METIKELIEQRNKLVADMRALVTVSEPREGPDAGVMNAEEDEKFTKIDAETGEDIRADRAASEVEAAEKRLQESSNRSAPPALENRARNPIDR